MSTKDTRRFTERIAAQLLPDRKLTSNKSTFGHVAVCAGRPGFWGAGALASEAAFRIGAGYVTWASEEPPVKLLRAHPEVLTASIADIAKNPRINAFVVGPGLGVTDATYELLRDLKRSKVPVVVDADALTVIAARKMAPLPRHWILTPHAGEMSRLLERSSEEINQSRFKTVNDAVEKFNCIVLLKGNHSLVANRKTCQIITSGNPALAKAGTGDVLAGFIGGLLAQGLSPIKAATLGAFIHGAVADEWIKSGKDIASLVASDVIHGLPQYLTKLRGEK
jgi:NAD(P)H-hydrate epimerase